MWLRIPFGHGGPGAPAFGSLDAELPGAFPFAAFRRHPHPAGDGSGDDDGIHRALAAINTAVHALSCEQIQAHHPDLRLMPDHAACWHPVGPIWAFDPRRRRWVPVLDLAWRLADGTLVRDRAERRERGRWR